VIEMPRCVCVCSLCRNVARLQVLSLSMANEDQRKRMQSELLEFAGAATVNGEDQKKWTQSQLLARRRFLHAICPRSACRRIVEEGCSVAASTVRVSYFELDESGRINGSGRSPLRRESPQLMGRRCFSIVPVEISPGLLRASLRPGR
jgi:hypothetical protein